MATVGRNDPCPCASGKKYKKCCGAPQLAKRAGGAGRQDHTDDLFGGAALGCVSMLDSFAREARLTSYRITPVSEYEVMNDLARSNEIYWREILYRAHFAASTALLRLREWLAGALRSHSDRNVLMLAAGLRGLLEAVGDTWQGVADVAPTLADHHTVVRDALAGKLSDQLYLLPELENDLIHFAYARKKHEGEYSPRLHDAKSAHECVSVLAESVPDVMAMYATLCEYSHPASPTVFRFATEGKDRNVLTFDPRAGAQQVRQLEELASRIGPTILAVGVSPCVVTPDLLT